MKEKACIPYTRKTLYLVLTFPMIVLYIFIAAFLWRIHIVASLVYLTLFIGVALCMSVVCVYWECPYVGRFAPCVGGFCLPSSRLALLWKNQKISEKRYKLFYNLAFFFFFGIILFPLYFLFNTNWLFALGYFLVVVVYWLVYSFLICPVCATRFKCPGGQMAMSMRKAIGLEE